MGNESWSRLRVDDLITLNRSATVARLLRASKVHDAESQALTSDDNDNASRCQISEPGKCAFAEAFRLVPEADDDDTRSR